MTAKLNKEITALISAKNYPETFTKNEKNENSIKQWCRLEYMCKLTDPNSHENHHVGEPATISESLGERAVEFLKTQIRSACKRIKELQRKRLYLPTMLFLRMKKARKLQE